MQTLHNNISISGDGFILSCLGPGTHMLELQADQFLLDIYIGGSEGAFDECSEDDAPKSSVPNSFNFLPRGNARKIDVVRTGPSIRFVFKLNAIPIVPARETLGCCRKPIWNHLDVAMLGAAEITKDYLHTPNHKVLAVETSFLRDLLAVRILQILNQGPPTKKVTRPKPVQEGMEFINGNLAEQLSLQQISEHVHISQFHFARMFRSVMGISVRRYVILRRIEMAQRMISHTDDSLAEVAYATGFSSQSHMTSVFRHFTGRTPATYRKMVSSRIDVAHSNEMT